MKFFVVCVLVIASVVVQAEYPADFPKCKNGDESCLTQAANEIVHKHFNGFRGINLATFGPLHIKELELPNIPTSPVNVALKFKKLDLIGLQHMQVKSFSGLTADFSGRTVFIADVPEVRLKGFYNLDGRVLLLPIEGEGPCDILLTNVHVDFSTDLKPVEKNGEIYGSLEHVKLELDVGSAHFQFDNLFNGDKELSDNMNKVINESSKEVFEEIKPSLAKGIGLIVKQVVNKVLDKYPYAEYFL